MTRRAPQRPRRFPARHTESRRAAGAARRAVRGGGALALALTLAAFAGLSFPTAALASPASPAFAGAQVSGMEGGITQVVRDVVGHENLGSALPASLAAGLPGAHLESSVTDEAGILDATAAQNAVTSLAKDGVGLWIVTYSDGSATAMDFAAQAWDATNLGRHDLLLVINVNPGDRSFAFGGQDGDSVWDESTLDEVRSQIRSALSQEDWDGAVAAIVAGAQETSSTGTGGGDSSSGDVDLSPRSSALGALFGLAPAVIIIAGIIIAVAWMMRKKNTPSHKALPGQAPEPLEALRTRAGNALVAADDAVRGADEELSYAQAQFGINATDQFTQALAAARGHLERAFELRKLLDDSIPDTEAEQRQMCGEILQRCQQAQEVIAQQAQAFHERRGLEANVPQVLVETRQRADEAERSLAQAQAVLTTLQAAYPAQVLTSLVGLPGQGERVLAAGRTALAQAEASLASGQAGAAVEQVRIAHGAIAQAESLAAQVSGARERLERAANDLDAAIASISSDLIDAERLAPMLPTGSLEPLQARAREAITAGRAVRGGVGNPDAVAAGGAGALGGDPLAALDALTSAEAALDAALAGARQREENDARARAGLEPRLARLDSQVEAVAAYISTHRGAVGASARTALSEARRHAGQARALLGPKPQQALEDVRAGESLVAQAQASAEADVRRHDDRPMGGPGGGGLDLGSLVLGGILLGGLGGHDDHHHGHGYPGWGGSFGGGNFGGGGFGGGGGGFSGGGGGFGGSGGSF